MWTLQRPDGGWQWPFRDTPPLKSDEHFGVTLAALGVGVAPENYAGTRGGPERPGRHSQVPQGQPADQPAPESHAAVGRACTSRAC